MKNVVKKSLLGLYGIIVVIIAILFFDWINLGKWGVTQNQTGSGTDNTGINLSSGIIDFGDTSGAVTEIGSGEEVTGGAIIEVPENPREYLEYIMEHGEGGVDYIVATPTNQPKMDSKTGDVNTQEMWNYLGNNKIKFEFDSKGRQGYIMFVTTRPIRNAYKLFLGIDGKTVGWIEDKTRLQSYSLNEYLFDLNSIKYYGKTKYLYADLSESPISINAVTSDTGNKVEKIIIFFK